MKKLAYILIAASIITACDKVDTPIEKPVINVIDSTTTFLEIDSSAINTATSKVYVEEFTGVKCQGCPAQTEKLLALQHDNEPEIIIVSYHEGTFAEIGSDEDYESDFTTDYGDAVHTPLDLEGYPSVLVNRATFPDEGNKNAFLAHNQWESPISKSIGAASKGIAVGVVTSYVASKDLFKVRVSLQATSAVANEHRLIVLCVEDSVIAEQKDQRLDDEEYPHRIKPDYVHRHLLRDQINSTSGSSGDIIIDDKGLASGEWVDWVTDYTIPESIVTPENCMIVAFVINSSTQEVVQAEEAHVISVE